MNMFRTIADTPSLRKLLVLLILPLAFLAMGAKWVEKPVENLDTIVGKWKGSGISAVGYDFEIEYVFRKDGSYDYWWSGKAYSDKGQRPPGTMRINAGKLEYKNKKGAPRTGVLQEDNKGRRMLRFHGDGVKFELRPVKK